MDNNSSSSSILDLLKKDSNDQKSSTEANSDPKKPVYYSPHPGNKFGLLISSVSPSSLTSLITLLLIIMAIPLTVFIAQRQQDIRQRANLDSIYITINPNNTTEGNTFIVSASGPSTCFKDTDILASNPAANLNCSAPQINCFPNNICVSNWTCIAPAAGNYIVKFGECEGKANLNTTK